MTAPAARPDGPGGARPAPWLQALALLVFLALAAAAWSRAWPTLKARACWTQEWPYDIACPGLPHGADLDQPSAVYAGHLQRNPGDARAWTWFAATLTREHDARVPTLLPRALPLAPGNAYLLALAADQQLAAQDWDAAARTLVTMQQRRQPAARDGLLALMQADVSRNSVLQLLDKDAKWLDPFLGSLDKSVALQSVQPFISTGIRLGVLQPRTTLGLIDRLKREDDWLDAYTLWVAWKGRVGAGLHNGAFDQPVLQRGFDWHWQQQPAARRGFRVQQVSAAPRPGGMLELTLTGRAALPTPLVWQDMLLPGQRYLLKGRYRVQELRSEEGLVWALRCASGGERWAQTLPIMAEERQWTSFELPFEPPPECAAAVSLRLETAAPWEARAGMTGLVRFDDFSLEMNAPTTNRAE